MAASQTQCGLWLIRFSVFTAVLFLEHLLCHSAHAELLPEDGPEVRSTRIFQVLDAILEHHISPPTMQQMLLEGVTGMPHGTALKDNKSDQVDERPRLAHEISNLGGRSAWESFLSMRLKRVHGASDLSYEQLEEHFLRAVANAIPPAPGSGFNYLPAKQFAVNQQLLENRYVGIGIALAINDDQAVMAQVFPRGPAYASGGKAGDVIVSIDEQNTKGMKIEQVIDKLRGQAGQPVSLVVRRPDSDETRTLNIVRGEVPMETVVGHVQTSATEWDFRADPSREDIAYLKITSIRGSTARELKEIAGKLHPMNFRAIILDLQHVEEGEMRHASMTADQLLGQGPMGSLISRGKKQEFTANADRLFAGLPMAVLIGPGTNGQAEWIAAAIQDQGLGFIVGNPTPGQGYVRESIRLPNGDAIVLATGKLQRAAGKSLVSAPSAATNMLPVMRRGMPGLPANEPPGKPPAGWNGVWPDHQVGVLNPHAIALVKLKELLSTQEPAAQ